MIGAEECGEAAARTDEFGVWKLGEPLVRPYGCGINREVCKERVVK